MATACSPRGVAAERAPWLNSKGDDIMVRTRTCIFAIAVITLFTLAVIPASYAAEQGQKAATAGKMVKPAMEKASMTVTGTIIANKNKKGKIISYAVQEDGGQTLLLSKHGKGMQLRKMVGEKVEATGTIEEVKSGKMIIVKEFKKVQ
jgi:hypothetical protein